MVKRPNEAALGFRTRGDPTSSARVQLRMLSTQLRASIQRLITNAIPPTS